MNSELERIAEKLGVNINVTLPEPDERPNDLGGFLTSYEEDLDITTDQEPTVDDTEDAEGGEDV